MDESLELGEDQVRLAHTCWSPVSFCQGPYSIESFRSLNKFGSEHTGVQKMPSYLLSSFTYHQQRSEEG